jgi:hypothetical protein
LIDDELYLKFVQVFLKLLFVFLLMMVLLIQLKVLENQKICFSHANDDDDDDDGPSFYNQLYIHEFHMDEI